MSVQYHSISSSAVLLGAALATGLLAPAAGAQHSDIDVSVAGARIVTDERVYGYDFGEVAGDPYFAGDPGFNADSGSGLPGGSQLLFDIPAATTFGLPSALSYWGGSGPVSFSSPPSGETLRFNFGSADATAGASPSAVGGFSLVTVAADGSLHRHLNSFLNGSDGNNDPADGSPPADGIYLVPMVLRSSDPSILPSEPLFIVFNNGLDEAAHDAAIEYVTANVVPEPASAGMLLAAAGLLLRRGPKPLP